MVIFVQGSPFSRVSDTHTMSGRWGSEVEKQCSSSKFLFKDLMLTCNMVQVFRCSRAKGNLTFGVSKYLHPMTFSNIATKLDSFTSQKFSVLSVATRLARKSSNFLLSVVAIISIYAKQNQVTGNPEAQAHADSILTLAAINLIKTTSTLGWHNREIDKPILSETRKMIQYNFHNNNYKSP